MAKAKQGLIRGMGTHRRTEGDYMAALLDTGPPTEPDDEPPNPLAMDPDDPASGFWG